MKILKYKKLKDNRYELELDNGNNIVLIDDVILKYNLLLKKSIDSKLLDEILKANNECSCYSKAIKYLGIKQRHKNEMIKYLEKDGYNSDVVFKIIKRLEEQHYLNEEEYIKSFINDQLLLTNCGPAKIKHKLLNIGANEDIILKYLNNISKKIWLDKLNKIIDKKIIAYKKESINKTKEKILLNCINECFKKEDIIDILEAKEIKSDLNKLDKEANKLYNKLKNKYQGSELIYQIKGRLLNKGYLFHEVEEALKKIE